MVIPKIAICPICNKKIYLRIEDGGYLDEYPIRVHCINCKALIKGTYIMHSKNKNNGLHLYNARVEECGVDSQEKKVLNADYVIDISGELPCKKVSEFDGNMIFDTPYLSAVGQLDIFERIKRLKLFNDNMSAWKKWRSIAFQLLSDGSIEHISNALHNKMGDYIYVCDDYLKSLHCLQEVVQEETVSLFYPVAQQDNIQLLLNELSKIDKNLLHEFVDTLGGTESLILYYKNIIDVFSSFMNIYPNILPAETFIRFKNKNLDNVGIATCSYSDIKTFYQDAYETILALIHIPVCIDNILTRGNYQIFDKRFNYLFKKIQYVNMENDYERYMALNKGKKLELINSNEHIQGILNVPANSKLRNGIGHNSVIYDGISQIITIYDQKDQTVISLQKQLIDMAVDCIGLAKTAVLIAEIILFILRQELRDSGINSILHPKYYENIGPNDKCPCGSNLKFKKCCKREVESIIKHK